MSSCIEILVGLRLTEKSGAGGSSASKYVFNVAPHANKIEIRRAVESLFGKKVISVNTSFVRGKARRKRTAQSGVSRSLKKAVVTLAAGESIDLG